MIYDDLANRLATEYRLLSFALAGRYQQIRAPGVEITSRVIADLNHDAHQLASTFYALATREIDDYMREQALDRSESLHDALVVRAKEVKAQIRRMLAENVQQVMKMARTGMSDYTAILKNAHGAVGLMVQRKAGEIEFKATDTSGRRWPAHKLLWVIVRDYGFQSALDSQLDEMRSRGIKLAAAIHLDDSGDVIDRVVFAIADDVPGYPSIDEVRDTVFHTNSTAQVVPHVPA